MTRDTSREAYAAIQAEGIVADKQLEAYRILYEKGPMTAREITRYFEEIENTSGITSYQPRLNELEMLGAVRRLDKRPCRVTRRRAYEWDVTSYVPTAADRERLRNLQERALAFLDDKPRMTRVRDECDMLYDEGGRSEDFYALILFLDERTA